MCSTEPTNVGKIFRCKISSHKIFSYVFCVRKYYKILIFSYVFCVRKYFYNENKANYSSKLINFLVNFYNTKDLPHNQERQWFTEEACITRLTLVHTTISAISPVLDSFVYRDYCHIGFNLHTCQLLNYNFQ